ncbi:MAG: response regulator transcription factor [Anaerolineae bacterium]|nr:response regulator transcription factor [Anaerolineae bacterium]
MRATKVLLIESARNNGDSFAKSLKRRYQVQIASSGKQALAMARSMRPDVIVLDAASLRTSGTRICARLRAVCGETPIIHVQPQDMKSSDSVADILLVMPFTARKLINRIERFAAVAQEQSVELGPFNLSLEQKTLVTPWSEKKLTPKLVALMELFMQNPNTVLDRKYIMQYVWKTDYMGDTRTLDVHIRWLRQIVEPSPRKPRYIVTVRGRGYRFVLNDEDPTPEPDAPGTETLEQPELSRQSYPAQSSDSSRRSRSSELPEPAKSSKRNAKAAQKNGVVSPAQSQTDQAQAEPPQTRQSKSSEAVSEPA